MARLLGIATRLLVLAVVIVAGGYALFGEPHLAARFCADIENPICGTLQPTEIPNDGDVRFDPGGPAAVPTLHPFGPTSTATSGTVTVTFRGTNGSDHVSCDGISSEFIVAQSSGRPAWEAFAGPEDHDTGLYFSSITFDPDGGVLEAGQARLVHMSGTLGALPGTRFYVVVRTKATASASVFTAIPFFC